MDIKFCDQCDASIPSADLDNGAASHDGGRLLCFACAGRERRRRFGAVVLPPLLLLLAAAIGAAAAVLVLSPRIDGLEKAVRDAGQAAPATDPRVTEALERLVDADREDPAGETQTK